MSDTFDPLLYRQFGLMVHGYSDQIIITIIDQSIVTSNVLATYERLEMEQPLISSVW